MQILESSDWGLRSARITLTNPASSKIVTLFPMVHIGEVDFYERVYKDALAHDLVLVEGVKSPVVTRLTRAYRWIAKAKRLQLVVQPKLPPQTRSGQIILADLSHKEFQIAWKRVSAFWKLLLYLVAPIYGLRQRWFATRYSLIKDRSLDDLPSRKEVLRWSPEGALIDRAILVARDQRLIECLDGALGQPGSRTIAIVHGAMHMRAVLSDLTRKRGFRVGDMEWMTAISL